MARLSMNEMTTYRWSFDEDVANYRAAGIPAIGVWRQKLADFGEEKGIELLNQSGMCVSNLLWAGGFTGSDGRSFRESLDDAAEAIRLAARMRAGCLIVYSGARAGHTHSHARRLLRDALREMLGVAADFDVTLAIEPMHEGCAAEFTFLTSLDDALELLAANNNPQLKLAFDTYHLGLVPGMIERIPQIVSQIAIVQLGDSKQLPDGDHNRCRLGEGTIPLKEIIASLVSAGYTGDFDVELMGEEIETGDYRQLLDHSRRAFERLMGAGCTM